MKNANENATNVAGKTIITFSTESFENRKKLFEGALKNLGFPKEAAFGYKDIVVSADEDNIKIYLTTIDIFDKFYNDIKQDKSLYSKKGEIKVLGDLINATNFNTKTDHSNIISIIAYEKYNNLLCIEREHIATLLTENIVKEINDIYDHYTMFNRYNLEEKINMITELQFSFNRINMILYEIKCILLKK